MSRKLHFAVVAVDGSIASAVYGPIELLHACRRLEAGLPEMEPIEASCEILSADGGPFLSTSGYRLPVDGGLKDLPARSVIFLPGLGLPPVDRLGALLERHAPLGSWLVRQHRRGCTIAASSTGNFLLAEHGLLPGKRATTYWAYADAFRARYPHVELDVDAALIEDERVLSVGGLVCGVDAVLAVIERFIGKDVARLCTKLLAIEARRPSELRYEQRQPAMHDDPLVDKAVHWIRGNLRERITVDDVLRQVPTSRRNLSRRFKLETGEGVQAFIQRLRIDRAKLLLETSNMPIAQIVDEVGYQDKSAFARQFKRLTRLTPNEFRRRFGLAQAARK